MNRRIFATILVLGLLVAAGAALLRSSFISFKGSQTSAASNTSAALDASLPAKITFNEHIQPVLSENCYFCHGQDATARKADLRVDRDEFAFLPRKSGLPAIVKGHPEIQRPDSAHFVHGSHPGNATPQFPQTAADPLPDRPHHALGKGGREIRGALGFRQTGAAASSRRSANPPGSKPPSIPSSSRNSNPAALRPSRRRIDAR